LLLFTSFSCSLKKAGETITNKLRSRSFNTVKLGDKERFDKEQIGVKELFMDYQPFYTIDLLLDKELLTI
jgi:hypothetical protein